jgi:branched-chain amino acid transport system permease protein
MPFVLACGRHAKPVMTAADTMATLLDAVLAGGPFALSALGFSLVVGLLRCVNLAHGGLLMLGMLIAWVLAAKFGIDPYASLPLVSLVLFAIGYALYAGVLAHVPRRRGLLLAMTAAVLMVIEAGAFILFGATPRTITTPYADKTITIASIPVAVPGLAAFLVCAVVGGIVWLFMTRTDTGRSIRAAAHEPEAARLVGIRPDRMAALAFATGSACVGAAACTLLPTMPVGPLTAPAFTVLALASVLLGRAGSTRGAIVVGLVIGMLVRLFDPSGVFGGGHA